MRATVRRMSESDATLDSDDTPSEGLVQRNIFPWNHPVQSTALQNAVSADPMRIVVVIRRIHLDA